MTLFFTIFLNRIKSLKNVGLPLSISTFLSNFLLCISATQQIILHYYFRFVDKD